MKSVDLYLTAVWCDPLAVGGNLLAQAMLLETAIGQSASLRTKLTLRLNLDRDLPV